MRYPELTGKIWLNSRPLSKDDLANKVVLFDFWTYTCINCRRTTPFLKSWWQKYKDKGLLIIGIHSPEFEFEKDRSQVEQSLGELGITWPVLLDNEYKNWSNFANRYWPAKYLADAKGNIFYEHFGEGAYRETEVKIQEALRANWPEIKLPDIDITEEEAAQEKPCIPATPELYCGYKRGFYVNAGKHQTDSVFYFSRPDLIPKHNMALDGRFKICPEYVEATEHGASLLLNFEATEVNLVMGPVSWGATIYLELDGVPLDKTIMGDCVNPNSHIDIYRPSMYNIIRSNLPVRGILQVKSFEWSPPFRAYAFTFSGCLE